MDFRFYVFLNETEAQAQIVLLARDNFHPILSTTTIAPDIMYPNGAVNGTTANANIADAPKYWVVRASK